MFIISFSQRILYDYSQGVTIIFLLSTSCPEVEDIGFIPYIIYRVVSLKLT